ncbi:MAG: monofunctional biosynthetic peptidoglycan transglycosylase [bacterium P3]|nr:MAG: monofunctional biosynthetic peptidoglycan transglycosylase [bacterium P3]KWW38679.1 MAG: monofunctional biosynthetic peptidoglycan transglycosylase [bacterium F083]
MVNRKSKRRSRVFRRWRELRWAGKVWRVVWVGVLSLWLLSLVAVVAFRFVFPPFTPLMVQRFVQQCADDGRSVRFERDYVRLDAISPHLVTAVVCSEDAMFLYHSGFDVKQLKQSYRENQRGRRVRGGSTISMQTAKNVFLPHTRTMLRKAVEAYFTQLIEWVWGKRRIMEVYLNVIEFGDGIYGCEAASQHYFGHSARTLSRREAAQLAVSLPAPMRVNPAANGPYFRRQTEVVLKRMGQWRVDLDMPRDRRRERYGRQENLWDFLSWWFKQRKKR